MPMFALEGQARRRPDFRALRATTDILRFEVCCAGEERHGTLDQAARIVLCVSGEVDVLTSPRLAAAVADTLEGGQPDVVIDLARVEFIDVTGIRVLENAAGQARDAGGSLALRSPSRVVRRMLDLLDLDRALLVEQ
jgi:anti-sigma B factor antagonist